MPQNRSALFTKDQKAALAEVLAPGADAEAKVALAGAIIAGTEGKVAPVLAALEADPVFKRSVKLLGLTGDATLVTGILRGQQKLDTDGVNALPKDLIIAQFDDLTGGVFDDAPVSLRDEMIKSVAALAAEGSKGIDATANPNEAADLIKQSIIRLTGATQDRNGDYTIGGLQEVNGGLTILPPGTSVTEVEATWNALENMLDGRMNLGSGPAAKGAPATREEQEAWIERQKAARAANPDFAMEPFAAASVYGGVPDLGQRPAERFANLTMRRVGETEFYELVYEKDGRLYAVPEKGSDGPYRFRLKDLVRGVKP